MAGAYPRAGDTGVQTSKLALTRDNDVCCPATLTFRKSDPLRTRGLVVSVDEVLERKVIAAVSGQP